MACAMAHALARSWSRPLITIRSSGSVSKMMQAPDSACISCTTAPLMPDQRAVQRLFHGVHLLAITLVHTVHLQPSATHLVAVQLDRILHALLVREGDDRAPTGAAVTRPVDHFDTLNIAAALAKVARHRVLLRVPGKTAYENASLVVVALSDDDLRELAVHALHVIPR